MNIKGMLIGVRRFSFSDKDSGELVKGAKLAIGMAPDNDQAAGYVLNELPALYEDYPSFAKACNELAGQQVVVECDVQLKGRYTKLRAVKISAA